MTSSMNPPNPMAYDFLSWSSRPGFPEIQNSIPQSVPHTKPPPKRSNRPTKRTTFTPEQVALLELEFAKNEYICKDRRSELALVIDLTECQVKTWFQNRRTKKRRCNSPLRKAFMMKSSERSPSPFIPPPQPVANLQTLFQTWPSHFTYPIATSEQQNKNT